MNRINNLGTSHTIYREPSNIQSKKLKNFEKYLTDPEMKNSIIPHREYKILKQADSRVTDLFKKSF